MRVDNFLYENDEQLKERLKPLESEANVFLQIFCNSTMRKYAQGVLDSIVQVLPQAKILITSSFAEISDGFAHRDSISICASIFKQTTIETHSFELDSPKNIAESIAQKVSDSTKLVIVFANFIGFDTNKLMDSLSETMPNITVAGGVASDDLNFSDCFVGNEDGIANVVVACAILNSDVLNIYVDSLFNCNRIGLDMVVTDCDDGGIIRKVNNQPVIDIYKRYLGKYISDTLPINGYQFPLTFYDGDLLVGRVAFIRQKDGALIFGGNIKKGIKVKFGVSSSIDIITEMNKQLFNLTSRNIDCFYAYSCAGRYLYFKDTIFDYNVKLFNNIAPTAGFCTYGEFFHKNNKNYQLNNTNSFVALCEEGFNEMKSNTIHEIDAESKVSDVIIYGLRNLSYVSNNDYLEIMGIFKQYKELLEKSAIVVYFNGMGDIIDANKLFLEISKYDRKKIIGKKFDSIIESDSVNTINDIWEVIQKRNTFTGKLKNKDANGGFFYTTTIIKPIVNPSDNKIMMYVCSMLDITDIEMQKQNLEQSVTVLTETSTEKEFIIQNYQNLLDRSTAMAVMRDEKFVDVNQSLVDIFGYSKDKLIGKHISILLRPSPDISETIKNIKTALYSKGYLKLYMNCINSNKQPIFAQVYLMAAKTKEGDTAYAILHNVTELFQMQVELEDVQKEVLYAMGTISEGRSRETGNHIKRVAEFTYLLSNLYGLDKKEAELYKIASPMHDIGKLAIPDHILHKPGKLTDEEFDEMKTHAQRGYDMLCWSKRTILKTAAEIALTHHEWWNGNGYPNKISGESIPLCGRIVAVADVFDALSHDRCYKKAWPINEVIEHFIKNKGVQFEERLVDLLIENIDEFIKIKERYVDTFDTDGGGGNTRNKYGK